jgi:hypothetical protein
MGGALRASRGHRVLVTIHGNAGHFGAAGAVRPRDPRCERRSARASRGSTAPRSAQRAVARKRFAVVPAFHGTRESEHPVRRIAQARASHSASASSGRVAGDAGPPGRSSPEPAAPPAARSPRSGAAARTARTARRARLPPRVRGPGSRAPRAAPAKRAPSALLRSGGGTIGRREGRVTGHPNCLQSAGRRNPRPATPRGADRGAGPETSHPQQASRGASNVRSAQCPRSRRQRRQVATLHEASLEQAVRSGRTSHVGTCTGKPAATAGQASRRRRPATRSPTQTTARASCMTKRRTTARETVRWPSSGRRSGCVVPTRGRG